MMLLIGVAVVIFLILLIGIYYMMSTPADSGSVLDDPLPNVTVDETPAVGPSVSEPEVVPPPVVTPTPAVAIQTPSGTTYTFHQGMDSAGGDIGNSGLANNIPALKAWCTEREACKGFNTNGWMKSVILPQSSWYRWTGPENTNAGLFVKNEHFGQWKWRNPLALYTSNPTEHFRRWMWRNPLVLFK